MGDAPTESGEWPKARHWGDPPLSWEEQSYQLSLRYQVITGEAREGERIAAYERYERHLESGRQ